MRRELLMPKLGLTMTEGTLVEWLVQRGDRFAAGQVLFGVESEKAAVEVTADVAGRLLEATPVTANALPVGAVIGYWDDGQAGSGEAVPPRKAVQAQAAPGPAEQPGP